MRYIALTAISMVAAGTAAAETEWYVSAGYTAYDSSDVDIISAGTVRGGVNVNANLGFEAEASFGFDGVEAAGAEVEIASAITGYVVGRLPISDQVDIFGRAGYGTIDFDVSGFGGSGSIDVDGFAFGIGGEFELTDRWSLRTEYTRFEADDDVIDGGVDTYAISVVATF